MRTDSLSELVQLLETENELIRVREFVNPILEMSEIADRMMKLPDGGKAILFENTGTKFPVLINHFGSDKRMFSALGISAWNDPGERIDKLLKNLLKPHNGILAKLAALSELKNAAQWMPVKLKGKGKCQEIILDSPDLNKLPVLKCWPYDGGRFFTLPMVITVDPETDLRNIGMYRMQVFDNLTTGMHWHLHKGGAAHFEKYKSSKKRMPVSVVLGGDPVLTYCATAPLPPDIDEFLLAGFLKNKKTELVKCLTNDIYVPACADFVIEGYIDPDEDFVNEGPFGDHTGFYSLTDFYPQFHVTCITHRKDAIYPATIVGIPPMEDFYLGKATERIFLKPIQIAIAPEIIDIRLPSFGVAHNLVIVKAKISYSGQSHKLMNALLGAGQMMFSKVIVCFNHDVDIYNDNQILSTLLNINSLAENLTITKGPSDVLDHSSYKYTFGGKLLIDASTAQKPNSLTKFFTEKIKIMSLDEFDNNKSISGINILVDNPYAINDYETLLWIVLSNIDPSHDISITNNFIVIDATVKTAIKNNFHRQWPNPVCMDDNTIETINCKWVQLTGLPLAISPSLRYKQLCKGNSAVYEEELAVKK